MLERFGSVESVFVCDGEVVEWWSGALVLIARTGSQCQISRSFRSSRGTGAGMMPVLAALLINSTTSGAGFGRGLEGEVLGIKG